MGATVFQQQPLMPILLAGALLVTSLSGCEAAPQAPDSEPSDPVTPQGDAGYEVVEIAPLAAETREACEMLISAIEAADSYRAANFYPETEIAGCDGGPSEEDPDIYHFRLNGVCHEEICGSVLIGWYEVEAESGRVWEWSSDMPRGPEITPG